MPSDARSEMPFGPSNRPSMSRITCGAQSIHCSVSTSFSPGWRANVPPRIITQTPRRVRQAVSIMYIAWAPGPS